MLVVPSFGAAGLRPLVEHAGEGPPEAVGAVTLASGAPLVQIS